MIKFWQHYYELVITQLVVIVWLAWQLQLQNANALKQYDLSLLIERRSFGRCIREPKFANQNRLVEFGEKYVFIWKLFFRYI